MITLNNQKPGELSPHYKPTIKGDFEPWEHVKENLVTPIFTPLSSNPVSLTINGNDTSDEDFMNILMDTFAETVDPKAEDVVSEVYSQGLLHYTRTKHLRTAEAFAIQAAAKLNLPLPSPTLVYTAKTDVIPAAKQMLSSSDPTEFFTSLAFAFHPSTLGVAFHTEDDFSLFKTNLDVMASALTPMLSKDVIAKIRDFQNLKLNSLTESIRIRETDEEDNEEYSFSRIFMWALMDYAKKASFVNLLPFDVNELFIPKTLVFVNVEKHARATPKAVNKEWEMINQSIASPVPILNRKKINRLTAFQRQAQKSATVVGSRQSSANRKVRNTIPKAHPPKRREIAKAIMAVMMRMKKVNMSQNIFTTTRMTFSKPNRRNPNDVNRMGRSTSTKYLPDIHIYLDVSGSISEENYQEAVMSVIALAKKLNVNIYVTLFSSSLGEDYLIKVRNRSAMSIWKQIQNIPKFTGGTAFDLVYRSIMASPKKQRRLSLMITDFGWAPYAQRIEHPRNLYYVPVSKMDWSAVSYMASQFTKSMSHIEPNIAQRCLGVFSFKS